MAKILILPLLFLCLALFSSTKGQADPVPACFYELQVNFFQWDDVAEALGIQRVNQGLWTPIIEDLKVASRKVPAMLHRQASAMFNDPTGVPFKRDDAFALLRTILFQIYSDVLVRNNIGNLSIISQSFAHIWNKQQARINGCYNISPPQPQ